MATKVTLEAHMQLVALSNKLANLAVASGALLDRVFESREALCWMLQDTLKGGGERQWR